MRANRLKLTIVGVAVAGHASLSAAASALEDTTYQAEKQCHALEAISLEACALGTSPAHSTARQSLIRMYNERAAFMRKCQERDGLRDCQYMAESDMLKGSNRAGDEYWKTKGFK